MLNVAHKSLKRLCRQFWLRRNLRQNVIVLAPGGAKSVRNRSVGMEQPVTGKTSYTFKNTTTPVVRMVRALVAHGVGHIPICQSAIANIPVTHSVM